ncbi:MAG TPA: hypothetical protein VFJ82_20210 [Longimicrobium sp.]|nr:hypothetical protein [Longimicrobium sp.]
MLQWLHRRALSRRAAGIEDELRALETEAAAAAEAARGRLFNRAGDLCTAAGLTRRGVVFYGRAVDAYLEAGYLGPASAMCRKILRSSPGAVRAHCTLACVAAHEGHAQAVRTEIRFFVEASRRTRTERLTIPRLRLIGEAVRDGEVKRYVAAQLLELGDVLGSERILASLEAAAAAGDDELTPEELQWQRLVRTAALDPDELWKYA